MTSLPEDFWDNQALHPAPTAHRMPVGSGHVLFDETSQQLFELNESSQALWDAIAVEATVSGAARRLVGDEADYPIAIRYARDAALEWLRLGVLRPALLAAPASQISTLRLGWSGCSIELVLTGDIDVSALAAVFADLSSTETPSFTLRIQQVGNLIFISDDQGKVCARSQSEWIPEVKAQLTAKILETVTAGFLMHAALVSRNNAGLLLCGAPGAGKTTLSALLSLAGFRYHADDIVQFSDAGQAVGAPFAPALKEGAWPIMSQMTEALPTYLRSDGQSVRYLRLAAVAHDPVQVRSILLLARQISIPARIEPVEPLEVLTAILGSAFSARGRLSRTGLASLIDCIQKAKIGRLCFSDGADARRVIEAFAP